MPWATIRRRAPRWSRPRNNAVARRARPSRVADRLSASPRAVSLALVSPIRRLKAHDTSAVQEELTGNREQDRLPRARSTSDSSTPITTAPSRASRPCWRRPLSASVGSSSSHPDSEREWPNVARRATAHDATTGLRRPPPSRSTGRKPMVLLVCCGRSPRLSANGSAGCSKRALPTLFPCGAVWGVVCRRAYGRRQWSAGAK